MSGWRANRLLVTCLPMPLRRAQGHELPCPYNHRAGPFGFAQGKQAPPLHKTWRAPSHVKITSVPRTDKKGASVGQGRADQCVDSGEGIYIGPSYSMRGTPYPHQFAWISKERT